MASLSFHLIMRSGPTPGKSFELTKSEIYIGRDIHNDVVINDAEVSRKHARLVIQAGGYVLEDLGSTNGTFVNGQQLSAVYSLHPGDTVQVADTIFRFADPQATLVAHKWPKLKIERPARHVLVNAEQVELSAKEYALLIYLDDHSDRICSKGEIAKAVWPEYRGGVFDYQVESLVKRLRQKLEPDEEESHFVVTMRGRGYRLVKA